MVIPPGGALSYSSLPRVRRVNSQRWEQSRCPHASLPMAGPDLSRSLMCHWQWNPEPPARVGVWGTGWPHFIPRQRWCSVLLLNVGDTDQRQVEYELTSLWGEALNFSFSGKACLTKYKLLNQMCNELLQKLPRLQFPPKREEPAFTDTGLQAQAFIGTLCPLLHFASHFYYFILDLNWH